MTTETTAPAAVIDVADLAQLLLCQADEARPGTLPFPTYSDLTMVKMRVAERLPEHTWERTLHIHCAIDLAHGVVLAAV